MHEVSNKNFSDLQAVLKAYIEILNAKPSLPIKEANAVRRAKLLLRALSKSKAK